jgi:hypothetical protein
MRKKPHVLAVILTSNHTFYPEVFNNILEVQYIAININILILIFIVGKNAIKLLLIAKIGPILLQYIAEYCITP